MHKSGAGAGGRERDGETVDVPVEVNQALGERADNAIGLRDSWERLRARIAERGLPDPGELEPDLLLPAADIVPVLEYATFEQRDFQPLAYRVTAAPPPPAATDTEANLAVDEEGLVTAELPAVLLAIAIAVRLRQGTLLAPLRRPAPTASFDTAPYVTRRQASSTLISGVVPPSMRDTLRAGAASSAR